MATPSEQRVIRHHDRYACAIGAHLAVAPSSVDRVVLSRTACDAQGRVAATLVDCSGGGVGMHTHVYLPKGSRIEVVVQVEDDGGATRSLRLRARVQRATMISRVPLYYLGAAFEADDAGAAADAGRLLAAARASDAEAQGRAHA